MAGARESTILQGSVGWIGMLGILGAILTGPTARTAVAAGPEEVAILGQFGENRYAASEAMRRLQAILDLVYGEAALQPQYVSVPFNRAVQQVQMQPDSCLSAVTRTAETEHQFRWLFPVSETRVIVIGAARLNPSESPTSLETLQRDQAEGIVTLDGAGQVILQKAGIRHDSRPAADTVVKMVAAERARYGVLLAVTFDLLGGPEKKAVRVLGDLERQIIWHACNTAFPAERADRLTAAHTRLEEDGRLGQLYTGFGIPLPRP